MPNFEVLEHERAVVRCAARAACNRWGIKVANFDYPEDWEPKVERPLDGLVATSGPTIAVEHTRYQSFVGEIDDTMMLRSTLIGFVQRLSGTLPVPGHYDLDVAPGAIAGHGRADLSPLEAWIREHAPTLSLGRAPDHFVEGGPPELPFAVKLYRWAPRGTREGTLDLMRGLDMEQLPARSLEQARETLAKKLPKLEEHRPTGGRTLLVFEEPGFQLVNTTAATDAVRGALSAAPGLPVPDAIVLVYTNGERWRVEWIKDGYDWYPTTRSKGSR